MKNISPKEKAIELYDNFYHLFPDGYNEFVLGEKLKRCSIIAVDEMMKVGVWFSLECQIKEDLDPNCTEEYWESVKSEIEKL